MPPEGITQRSIPRGGYQNKPSDVLVADDGRVADVRVRQSAGHPELDQAAVDAVRRWRFEPARRGSDAIAMWVQLPVEFRLR